MKTPRKTAPAPNEAPSSVADFQARDFQAQIAEAAYYQAEQRGFAPGFEMEDWLAAEAQARVRLDKP